MMNKTKQKIIEELKNSPFKGKLFEGQCEFWADSILTEIQKEVRECLSDEEENSNCNWDSLSEAGKKSRAYNNGFNKCREIIKTNLTKKGL